MSAGTYIPTSRKGKWNRLALCHFVYTHRYRDCSFDIFCGFWNNSESLVSFYFAEIFKELQWESLKSKSAFGKKRELLEKVRIYGKKI